MTGFLPMKQKSQKSLLTRIVEGHRGPLTAAALQQQLTRSSVANIDGHSVPRKNGEHWLSAMI
ncbi:MAG: hypothetical protein ACK40C_12995, partial [Novosphingobium meiothermophilum]